MYNMNNRTNENEEKTFFSINKIRDDHPRNCFENSYLDKINTTLKWSKNPNFNNIFIYQNSDNTMRQKLIELEKNKNNQILFQQSKMAAMGAMIENIVHQWKQPLSLIAAVSSGMKFKNDAGELESIDIDKSTESINDSVQHLAQTLDDFRNFFKEDKYSKEFLLNETFDKVLRLLLSHFIPHNILIVKDIEEIRINGYENELIQVLINILNNARDELIKIEEAKKHIFIDVHLKDEYLEISIKDNAGGISDKIID
ncbi:MAG: HAMP domain-containing histidine kinase, partial [Campylobacteraceae bacterium]|nr:HAMP domain-containing histidine kinase [Campylobacteraceae bacterium]